MTEIEATLEFDAFATLGEGPAWNRQNHSLMWVDINGKTLNIYNPKEKKNQTFQLDSLIGAAAPTNQEDVVIVALQSGLQFFNLKTQKLSFVDNPEADNPNTRFNDGKCDPEGRYWIGTMSLKDGDQDGTAVLYRLEENLKLTKQVDGLSISNGLAWSPTLDANHLRTFYLADTPKKEILAFDHDPATGKISNKRIAFKTEIENPDGMTIDVEGKLWIAHFGQSCVVRYDPKDGRVLLKVKVPVSKTTCPVFGGEEMGTLFITTSNEEVADKEPHSGGIFSCRPGVAGVETFQYKGTIRSD